MILEIHHRNIAGQEYRIAWEVTANRVTSFESAGRAMAYVEQLCQQGHLLDHEVLSLMEDIGLRTMCQMRRVRATPEGTGARGDA